MITRRSFLRRATVTTGGLALGGLDECLAFAQAPAGVTRDGARPQVTAGVQSGDLMGGGAVVWSRCDRPARLLVEYATNEAFREPRRVVGPAALPEDDFTARVELASLPAGQTLFYRVRFQDLADPKSLSEPVTGRFRTPPHPGGRPGDRRDVLFAWGGDTVGQGWGIDPERSGMRIYETMRALDPDFFIHSGDTIYADGPLRAEVRLDDGTLWKNRVTEEKAKVAETLAEFHGHHRYNFLDENLRCFAAQVPLFAQWDDHETRNNWFPGQVIEDPRYTVRSADLLAARGKRAFMDYMPMRRDPRDPERIYRAFRYGPLLEVFMLDERSYRGPNTANRQREAGPETAFLGSPQLRWLKRRLRESRAAWKVIASDMPLGLVIRDGPTAFEAVANGDGPALGRELEIAELLRSLKRNRVRNVVWLTADVHYAAAHHYDPARAQFTEFDPFWEFVAGPLHAGTFGPGTLENTFGPEAKFIAIPQGMKANRPPSDGHQFFGTVRIDGRTAALTVVLYNAAGQRLYSVDLPKADG